MSDLKKVAIIILLIGIIIELTAQLIFHLSFIYSVLISLVFCTLIFVFILVFGSLTSKHEQVILTEEDASEESNVDANAIGYKRAKL